MTESSRPLAARLADLRDRPESITDLAEDLLEAHVPAWQGYIEWMPSRVRAQAQRLAAQARAGMLPKSCFGLPVSIKDNIGLAGWSVSAGSHEPLPSLWQRDAAISARFRQAGALFTGVTHTVPFAFTSLGITLAGEGPRNPWNSERVCGGSSSGAAVSVIEGSAWLALGSDTAGSVRVPAAMTGCVGLKLTHGRWPMEGVVPLSHTLDSLGVLARSAADLTDALKALEGERLVAPTIPSLGKLRLGVLRSAPRENADAGIDDAFDRALQELEATGVQLVDIDLPEAEAADALFRSGGVVAAELEMFLSLRLPTWYKRLMPPLDGAMTRACELSHDDYRQRINTFLHLSSRAAIRLDETHIDALVLPTTPLSPPRRDTLATPAAYTAADDRILRHTAFLNYLQWCAMSLPVGLDAVGMPVGLQLAMPGFAEKRLLGVAVAIERGLGPPFQRLGLPPHP
ncbi:amidase [Chromohalobacter sp. 296-RDG]|uniref:amidase n=1 Tax=Chromohalobacter sp. 296-RDG TaxID=2994062 RepID=UPI0024683B2D|nr:amidase [Chromohalobacter sp. 296-RDG]